MENNKKKKIVVMSLLLLFVIVTIFFYVFFYLNKEKKVDKEKQDKIITEKNTENISNEDLLKTVMELTGIKNKDLKSLNAKEIESIFEKLDVFPDKYNFSLNYLPSNKEILDVLGKIFRIDMKITDSSFKNTQNIDVKLVEKYQNDYNDLKMLKTEYKRILKLFNYKIVNKNNDVDDSKKIIIVNDKNIELKNLKNNSDIIFTDNADGGDISINSSTVGRISVPKWLDNINISLTESIYKDIKNDSNSSTINNLNSKKNTDDDKNKVDISNVKIEGDKNKVNIPNIKTEEDKNKGKENNIQKDKNEKVKKEEKNKDERKVSDEYIIIDDSLMKDGSLALNKKDVKLPKMAYIGIKRTGEYQNKEHEIEWSGVDIDKVNNVISGEYNLIAQLKDDLIINDKNYGKVAISVKVRVK
ncbi:MULTISPECIES: hypothetical protein [Helcococcus]|uniref:Uncharacterized protein n=1 Tax=Helcococcus bovis TaxID=3153252 RepID=A0ABW9F871_9FIRM